MTKDELVSTVKQIISMGREGDVDGTLTGYKTLFSNPGFADLKAEEQRQALKLLVLAKRSGKPAPGLLDAIRSCVGPLTNLVSLHNEPEDFEMLGVCHVLLGNDASASAIFKEGLRLERERSAQSDLCGRLMTRLSAI